MIVDANQQQSSFYIIFKGQVIEDNHIYLRDYNKWPLTDHRWQVKAIYHPHTQQRILSQF